MLILGLKLLSGSWWVKLKGSPGREFAFHCHGFTVPRKAVSRKPWSLTPGEVKVSAWAFQEILALEG